MLRTLFSVIIVILFGVMSYLVYHNYVRDSRLLNAPPSAPSESTPPAPPPQELARPVVTAPKPPEILPIPVVAPAVEVIAAPEKPVLPPPVAAPELKRTHTVQAGDTLWAITRQHYGNPDLFQKVADANNMRGKTLLRKGQILILPPISGHPFIEETTAAPEAVALSATADHESPPEKIVETATPALPDTTITESPNFEPQPPTLSVKRRKPVILDE